MTARVEPGPGGRGEGAASFALDVTPAPFGLSGVLRNIFVYFFAFYAITVPLVTLIPCVALSLVSKAGRRLTHFLVDIWIELFIHIFAVRIHVDGIEHTRVDGPLLIVGNHRSWLDVLSLITVLKSERRLVFMIKRGLTKIPLFGWYMRLLGFVAVDREKGRDNRAQVARAIAALASGETLVIFPEGTRTPTHRFGRFKRGAAEVALAARPTVVPVVVSGTARLFPRATPLVRPGDVRIEFLPPIPITGDEDRDALTERFLDLISRRYRLSADGPPAEDVPGLLDALRPEPRTSAHKR